MAHVQRAGRVGRDEFDQHALAVAGLVTKALARAQHLTHHFLLGSGLEADVQEAGACDFNRIHPALVGGGGLQRGLELFAQGAGVELEGLGQLHGSRAGKVAVGGDLRGFKGRLGTSAGRNGIQRGSQRGQEFVFDREHRRILRVPTPSPVNTVTKHTTAVRTR